MISMLIKINTWEKDIDKIKDYFTSQISSLVKDTGLECNSYYINKKILKPESRLFQKEEEAPLVIRKAASQGNLKKIREGDKEVAFSLGVYFKGLVFHYFIFRLKAWNVTNLKSLALSWSVNNGFPQHYYEFSLDFMKGYNNFMEDTEGKNYREEIKKLILGLQKFSSPC